jgi:hypothetical protein
MSDMEGKIKQIFILKIGPVLGTSDWGEDHSFAEDIKPEDYSRIVESLRTLADDIEEEHTTVRRD